MQEVCPCDGGNKTLISGDVIRCGLLERLPTFRKYILPPCSGLTALISTERTVITKQTPTASVYSFKNTE